jgi:hypothetical protein
MTPNLLAFVDLAPMPDSHDRDQQPLIVDHVHHAIVPDPNPPLSLPTLQLLATSRTRLNTQSFEPRKYPLDKLSRQTLQLLPRTRFDLDRISSHEAFHSRSSSPSPYPTPHPSHAAASLRSAHPVCPPKAPYASSGRSRQPSYVPFRPSKTGSRPYSHLRTQLKYATSSPTSSYKELHHA